MTDDPFDSTLSSKLRQASKTDNLDAASNALFGPTVDKYSDYFEDLKQDLKEANMDVLYRTYVAKTFFFTCVAVFLGFIGGITFSIINGLPFFDALRLTLVLPILLGLGVFGFRYVRPSRKSKKRKEEIENNLPFALNHLGAIATSGIPPKSMFELLTTFDEYGVISDEAEEISRRVNVFGEDLTTALKEVAEKSPSNDWAEVLYGIISTVETGGSLESYIQEKADEALFEYNVQREKEIEKISTYASFYTAIMIAAPVFLVVVLAVMNLLGGNIAGFSIENLMWLGVHVIIPGINILFVLFLAFSVD